MDVKVCIRVSKFKMSDSKGVPKTAEILSRLFLTYHLRDCSDFFDMIGIDIYTMHNKLSRSRV